MKLRLVVLKNGSHPSPSPPRTVRVQKQSTGVDQSPDEIRRWDASGKTMVSMEIDSVQRKKAVNRLRMLDGLSEEGAAGLVDAALSGAVDLAFELINGSGPVPTA